MAVRVPVFARGPRELGFDEWFELVDALVDLTRVGRLRRCPQHPVALLLGLDEDGDDEADTAPSVHQSAAPVVSAEETPVHVALHKALKGPEKSAQELEAVCLAD